MINVEPLLLKIKHRRLFVMLAPAVVGLMLGGQLILRPGLNNLGTLRAELAGLQQKVPSYQFILDGETRTAEYKTRFPGGDRTWLIDQINASAEKTGVSILTILPEDVKKAGDLLDRISVRIDAEGNYHQLGEFVSRLESLDPYIKFFGVNIDAEASLAQNSMSNPSAGSSSRANAGQNDDVYEINMSVGLLRPTAEASL